MNANELIDTFRERAAIAQLPVPQVLGDGDVNAELAIIAEAPGATEIQLGKPLVGGSGRYLWDTLRKYSIVRSNCYVTNVVKYRLLGDDDAKQSINNAEFEHWASLLRWELSCLPNLKYVLVLGSYALRAVAGHSSIKSWRGSVVSLDGITYVFANNPAAVNREPMLGVVFGLDINKLVRVMKGQHAEPKITPIINPSPDEAIRYIERLRDEQAPVSLDIETVASETACIGLTNSVATGMCINFRTRDTNRFTTSDERRVREAVQRLLISDRTRLVAQNGVFDCSWLWYKDRIRARRVWFDTLLAHHALYPALPHNLAFLVAQYTDHPFYKDEKDAWKEGGDIDTFWAYNVKDVCLTLMVQRALHQELIKQKMDKFFFDHVMRVQPHIVAMGVTGVKCDVELKAKISEELHDNLTMLRAKFTNTVRTATGDPSLDISPQSPKQLSDLFFNRLKLVGRGVSTDKENRERMRSHPRTSPESRACLETLDEYLKEQKFYSTYATAGIDDDGRFRTEYKQFGTQSAPGRLSSSATAWETGLNLQNQPERAKAMFVADPGYGFVYFDMAQIEARIVGWLANIKTWKAQFEQARIDGKYDAHRALASDMFEVPYDQVPTSDRDEAGEPTIRFIAKRCRHGLNYGMAADKLATVTKLPMQRAIDAFNRYHRINPEIRKWHVATEQRLRQDRVLYTPYGRRLLVLGRYDDDLVTTAIAFVPQSTAGDHVVGTIYLCHDDPRWPHDARIVLNIHDALIALCPLDKMEICGKIMKEHAERPMLINGETLIVPADLAHSYADDHGVHRWSQLKKVK